LCVAALSAKATVLTNWARAGTATESSVYGGTAVASRAIDGNISGLWTDNSTTQTANNTPGEWWQVDLGGTKPIGHIHLWFREDCCQSRNDDLHIVVFDSTNTTTRVSLWETNTSAWDGAEPRDLGFDISPTLNGRLVFVEHVAGFPDYISLAEVEVLNQPLIELTDYALQPNNGASSSSSSCYQQDCTDYGPQYANNGDRFGVTPAVPPFSWSAPDISTNGNGTLLDPLPWWEVELAAPQSIGSVVIWPVHNATYARYQNIQLTVADPKTNTLYQQMFVVQPSGTRFVVNFVPALTNGQIVMLNTTPTTPDTFLNLAEVEVFPPYASAPAITITHDLQPVTTAQNLTATLGPVVATVDGGIRPENISYRWYRNGVEIPGVAGSWLSSYTTPRLGAVSTNQYKVQVSVSGFGVFSSEVTLTVTNDITPPTIVSNQVQVTAEVNLILVFSKLLDPTTATNLSNFTLAGGPTVGSLKLGADGETVTMVVQDVVLGDNIALTVSGVKDLAGNTIVTTNLTAAIPQTPINYALGGRATESSEYTSSTTASKAIDGNTAGNWGAGSIACTANDGLGWWQVDLGSPKLIGDVTVWFRTDCCSSRNCNIDLVVYDTDNTNTWQAVADIALTGTNLPPSTVEAAFGTGVVGQVVYLYHTPATDTTTDINNEQMCLAEVQVFPPPSGLIVTPDPSSWNVYAGDRIILLSGATGQQPITTQWQHNGVDIPGATAPELVITNITPAQAGTYVFVATNAVRHRASPPATVVVNPRPPMAYNLVARYLFNADDGTNILDDAPLGFAKTASHDGVNSHNGLSATWVSSVTDSNNVTRTGVMEFNGSDPDQLEIPPHIDFDSNVGAIAFWIVCAPPAVREALLFDRRGGTNNWGDLIVINLDSPDSPNGVPNALYDQAYPCGINVGGTVPVDDGRWHHIAYVYTWIPFGIVSFYIDGKLDQEKTSNDPGAWPLDQELEFGTSHDSYWTPYTGYMDDIYIFNRSLNPAELTQLMTSGVPPIPPKLTASVTGTNLTLSWPGTGYVLQQNSNLANSAGWTNVLGATASPVTTPLPRSGNDFYRLEQQ